MSSLLLGNLISLENLLAYLLTYLNPQEFNTVQHGVQLQRSLNLFPYLLLVPLPVRDKLFVPNAYAFLSVAAGSDVMLAFTFEG
jgi:hypothetical protein